MRCEGFLRTSPHRHPVLRPPLRSPPQNQVQSHEALITSYPPTPHTLHPSHHPAFPVGKQTNRWATFMGMLAPCLRYFDGRAPRYDTNTECARVLQCTTARQNVERNESVFQPNTWHGVPTAHNLAFWTFLVFSTWVRGGSAIQYSAANTLPPCRTPPPPSHHLFCHANSPSHPTPPPLLPFGHARLANGIRKPQSLSSRPLLLCVPHCRFSLSLSLSLGAAHFPLSAFRGQTQPR